MKDDLNTTLAHFLLYDYKKTCEYMEHAVS